MQQSTQVVYSYTIAFDSKQLQDNYRVDERHAEHFITGFIKNLDEYFQGKCRYIRNTTSVEFYCVSQLQQQQVRDICNQLFAGLTTMLLNPWFIERILDDLEVYDGILEDEAIKILHNIDRVNAIGQNQVGGSIAEALARAA